MLKSYNLIKKYDYKSMIEQKEISIDGYKRGYHLITDLITTSFDSWPQAGILNILVKHTSAGVTINENADPSVRKDFASFIDELIPERHPLYTHIYEGDDDMPAHLKASLIGQSISIPISNGGLNLGTWQGIYFCEFRDRKSLRKLVLTMYY